MFSSFWINPMTNVSKWWNMPRISILTLIIFTLLKVVQLEVTSMKPYNEDTKQMEIDHLIEHIGDLIHNLDKPDNINIAAKELNSSEITMETTLKSSPKMALHFESYSELFLLSFCLNLIFLFRSVQLLRRVKTISDTFPENCLIGKTTITKSKVWKIYIIKFNSEMGESLLPSVELFLTFLPRLVSL